MSPSPGATIATIGPAARTDSPADAANGRQIDATGKTLVPGLIDAHWHTAFTTVPAQVAIMGELRLRVRSGGGQRP